MARTFASASSQYLSSSATATVHPFTLSAWARPTDATPAAAKAILSIGNSGANTNWAYLVLLTGGNLQFAVRGVTDGTKNSTGTLSNNTWAHCCGIATSIISRTVALNGAVETADTSAVTDLAGVNASRIGRATSSAFNQYWDGDLAECAVWDVALADAEVAILATGISPLLVRPGNLISYWPVIGRFSPEIDVVGGIDMTVNAAPAAASHTRVIMPSPQASRAIAAAAASSVGVGLLDSVLLGRRRLAS